MQVDDEFLLFVFEVDNAATIERSVGLLSSKLPTHPLWVLEYLRISRESTIAKAFVHQITEAELLELWELWENKANR